MNGRRRGSRSGPRSIHGQQRKKRRHHAWKDDRADHFPLAWKILQQLEQPEEIPLGPRNVVGIGGIGRTLERRHAAPRHRDDREKDDRDDDRVAERLVRVERKRPARLRTYRPRAALQAHEHEMRDDQPDQQRRQEDHVRGVPTRERQRTDRRSALEHCRHRITRDRRQPRDVDRDDRRPVRALIPRQQIPRQRESQDEAEERQPGEPRDLARRLVRPEHDDAQQVQDEKHDEKARAEVVEPADETPGRRAADEADALVRVIRRRRVVERQESAGEQLDRDEGEEHAAEREDPSRPRGNLFVEQDVARRTEAGPRVEPLQQPILHAGAVRHTRTSTVSSAESTRASIVVSGRGGGPSSTWPLTS